MNTDFWKRLDELISTSEIVIDRPKGTRHPRYPEVVFPVDYGYLKDTVAADGNEIDVWSGTAAHRKLTAIAATVDILKKDTEIKLIVGCTEAEIMTIKDFHNNQYMSAIIIRRESN
jgi:inorganic pyrophosphatase